MEAYNINGFTLSETIGFVFGSIPKQPTDAPVSDLTFSNSNILRITYLGVNNNGSPVVSYNLEIDDGNGGEFVSLYGDLVNTMTLTYTFSNNVQKGDTYRARYRALNQVGWSGFSPIGYLIAASVPDAPQAPQFVSATTTTISILVPRVLENNGSPVTHYVLFIDDGLGGNFSPVNSYDQNPAFLIDASVETTLVSGRIYGIKSQASNVIGTGAFSD